MFGKLNKRLNKMAWRFMCFVFKGVNIHATIFVNGKMVHEINTTLPFNKC